MLTREKPPPNPFGDVLGGILYLAVAIISIVLISLQTSAVMVVALWATVAVAVYESVKCFARASGNS